MDVRGPACRDELCVARGAHQASGPSPVQSARSSSSTGAMASKASIVPGPSMMSTCVKPALAERAQRVGDLLGRARDHDSRRLAGCNGLTDSPRHGRSWQGRGHLLADRVERGEARGQLVDVGALLRVAAPDVRVEYREALALGPVAADEERIAPGRGPTGCCGRSRAAWNSPRNRRAPRGSAGR